MNKIFVLIAFLLLIPSVFAASSIENIMDDVVKGNNYFLVLGDEAPASDSLAATSIASGVLTYSNGKVKLKAILASEISGYPNMILFGHPCKNEAIPLSCDNWKYEEGETLVKVDGNNLIVAGSTPEDTRHTAKLLAKYKENSEFNEDEVIIIRKFVKTEKSEEVEPVIVKELVDESAKENMEEPEKKKDESMAEEKEIIKEKSSFLSKFFRWLFSLFRR